MKKAINMQAQVHMGNGAVGNISAALEQAFSAANPGMTLTVKSLSAPDGSGNSTARVYIEGEQDPAADFAALAGDALHKAVAHLAADGPPQPIPLALHDVQEVDTSDDDTGLVLPPQQAASVPATSSAAGAPAGAASPPVPVIGGDHTPPPSSLPASAGTPADTTTGAPASAPDHGKSHRHQHNGKRGGGHSHSG